MAQRRLSEDRNKARMAEVAAATDKVVIPAQPRRSIKDYTEELRQHAKHPVETGADSSDQEESSGYVIDYEQVLKDSSAIPQQQESPAKRYRDPMGQNTILEQTREARDSSSEPETDDQDLVEEEERDMLSPTQKTAIVRESP